MFSKSNIQLYRQKELAKRNTNEVTINLFVEKKAEPMSEKGSYAGDHVCA